MGNYTLREGDLIDFMMEEVNGKPVAKSIGVVPQEATFFADQWMKGTVKSFVGGYGALTAPRIWGDIWFGTADIPQSLQSNPTGRDVMFRLQVGAEGKPQATLVNPLKNIPQW